MLVQSCILFKMAGFLVDSWAETGGGRFILILPFPLWLPLKVAFSGGDGWIFRSLSQALRVA